MKKLIILGVVFALTIFAKMGYGQSAYNITELNGGRNQLIGKLDTVTRFITLDNTVGYFRAWAITDTGTDADSALGKLPNLKIEYAMRSFGAYREDTKLLVDLDSNAIWLSLGLDTNSIFSKVANGVDTVWSRLISFPFISNADVRLITVDADTSVISASRVTRVEWGIDAQ